MDMINKILKLNFKNFASGAGDANYFEPLLAHFNKLMLAYQAEEEGESGSPHV